MKMMTTPTPQLPARVRMPASTFRAAAPAPDYGLLGPTCVQTKVIGIDVDVVGDVPGIRSWSPPV